MKKLWLVAILVTVGCAAKKPPAPLPQPIPPPAPQVKPLKSQMPPSTAELIEHCVVVKEENANTVTCACIPVTTKIDSKTGKTAIVCKKMKEER
jgi:hypothetical protein